MALATPADIGWMAMLALAHGRQVTAVAAAAASAAGSPATRARKRRQEARARRAEKAQAAAAARAEKAASSSAPSEAEASAAADSAAEPGRAPVAPEAPPAAAAAPPLAVAAAQPDEGAADAPAASVPAADAVPAVPERAAPPLWASVGGRFSPPVALPPWAPALGAAALLAATLRLLLPRGARAAPDAAASPSAAAAAPGARAGSEDEACAADAADADAEDAEADEVGDAMRAPVLRGSALSVRRAGAATWQEFLVLLRADQRLYLRDPTGGATQELPLHGAVAAGVDGEPACFSLQTQQEACFVRCRNKGEAEGWVRAINDTAMRLGAPLLAQMGGGLAPPPPPLRTPMAAQASYSSEEEDEEEDAMILAGAAAPAAAGGRMVPHGWANARGGARRGAPALRGVVLASRALLGVAVAPVRVSAALVILPFALAAHGVAALAGSARAALGGGGGGGAVLDPAAECERRMGDASNPARAPLLDRYLGECLDTSVHERVLDTALSPGERAAQEVAWARARAYDPDAAAAGAGPVPLSDLRRAAPARPVMGSAATSPREELEAPAEAEAGPAAAAEECCALQSASPDSAASAPRSPEIATTPRSLALMAQAHGGGAPSPTRAAQLLSASAAAGLPQAAPEAIALTPPGEEAPARQESAGKVAKTEARDAPVEAAVAKVEEAAPVVAEAEEEAAPVVAPAAPDVRPAAPPADASLGDTLGELMRVDADAARAAVTAELGPVFEHGGVCFCGAA